MGMATAAFTAVVVLSISGCGKAPEWPKAPSLTWKAVIAGKTEPIGMWPHASVKDAGPSNAAAAIYFPRTEDRTIDFVFRVPEPIRMAWLDTTTRLSSIVTPSFRPRVFLTREDKTQIELALSVSREDRQVGAVQIPPNYTTDVRTVTLRVLLPSGDESIFQAAIPAPQSVGSPPLLPAATVSDVEVSATAEVSPAGPFGQLPYVAANISMRVPNMRGIAYNIRGCTLTVPEWKLQARLESDLFRFDVIADGKTVRSGVGFADVWPTDPKAATIEGLLAKERFVDEVIDFGEAPIRKQGFRRGMNNDASTLVGELHGKTASGLPVKLLPCRILDKGVASSSGLGRRFVATVVIDAPAGQGLPKDNRTGPVKIALGFEGEEGRAAFYSPEFDIDGQAIIGGDVGLRPNQDSARIRLHVRRKIPSGDAPFKIRVPIVTRPRGGHGIRDPINVFTFDPDATAPRFPIAGRTST
jgi:hypothetical protein